MPGRSPASVRALCCQTTFPCILLEEVAVHAASAYHEHGVHLECGVAVMIVVLTTDLYLVEWTASEAAGPVPGQDIETDQGSKTIMKIMKNDNDERGVPGWATTLRASLVNA